MATWKWITELYETVLESGDPRTNQWPLVQSPVPSVGFIGIYVPVAIAGSIFIKLKKPLPIQPLMVAFNVAVALACCYLTEEFVMSAYLSNYSIICEPVHVTEEPLSLRIANAFWLFYMLRFATALDTVFLILRSKPHQIPIFQVFHHASAPFASWLIVKYAPGGQAFFHGTINAAVCVIAYFYRAAQCYPSTKKYVLSYAEHVRLVSVMELTVAAFHASIGWIQGCFTPNWILVAMTLYFSAIVLILTLGKGVNILDLLDALWPRWLCGSWIITQMKKHHPPQRPK